MSAFLRGVFLLRPAGFPDDGAEGGDEFFMNDPELDGGAGDLGAVFVQPALVQVKEKAVQVMGAALTPFFRNGGEFFPAFGTLQFVSDGGFQAHTERVTEGETAVTKEE